MEQFAHGWVTGVVCAADSRGKRGGGGGSQEGSRGTRNGRRTRCGAVMSCSVEKRERTSLARLSQVGLVALVELFGEFWFFGISHNGSGDGDGGDAIVPGAKYAVVWAPPGGVVEEPVAMVVLCTTDCIPKLECPRDSRAALREVKAVSAL